MIKNNPISVIQTEVHSDEINVHVSNSLIPYVIPCSSQWGSTPYISGGFQALSKPSRQGLQFSSIKRGSLFQTLVTWWLSLFDSLKESFCQCKWQKLHPFSNSVKINLYLHHRIVSLNTMFKWFLEWSISKPQLIPRALILFFFPPQCFVVLMSVMSYR